MQTTFAVRETRESVLTDNNHPVGMIFDIQRFGIHDGPGIRTIVFLKECPLNCWWCHNPEGRFHSRDLMYFEYRCTECNLCIDACPKKAISSTPKGVAIDGEVCNRCSKCSEICPSDALVSVGRELTVEQLMEIVERDVLLYDRSGGGVTFSGGEPLAQPVFLKKSLEECKVREIQTAIETSGYASRQLFDSISKGVDIFLYDLKLMDDEEHRKYCGCSNANTLCNLKALIEDGRGKDVTIRFPFIPGITDSERNISALVGLLPSLKGVKEIDILPYHDAGEKYARLGMQYNMKVHSAPPELLLKSTKERFEKIGLVVKIGG